MAKLELRHVHLIHNGRTETVYDLSKKNIRAQCERYDIPFDPLWEALWAFPRGTADPLVEVEVFRDAHRPKSDGLCKNCGGEIKVAIFRGGDWCSDNCRKALGEDIW